MKFDKAYAPMCKKDYKPFYLRSSRQEFPSARKTKNHLLLKFSARIPKPKLAQDRAPESLVGIISRILPLH